MLSIKSRSIASLLFRGPLARKDIVRRCLGGSSNNNNTTTTTTTATFPTHPSSSNNNNNNKNRSKSPAAGVVVEPVYVHPLSQIVLMYLQDQCHDWIIRQGVDRLKIHRDGTFCLEFPHNGGGRIWTFYDPTDKKHWLSFQRHEVQHRFLLQDNLMPAWNGNKRQSLPQRIQKSVQELVQAVEELQEDM